MTFLVSISRWLSRPCRSASLLALASAGAMIRFTVGATSQYKIDLSPTRATICPGAKSTACGGGVQAGGVTAACGAAGEIGNAAVARTAEAGTTGGRPGAAGSGY